MLCCGFDGEEDRGAENVCMNSTPSDPSLVLLVIFLDLLNNPDKFYSFFRITTENFKKLVDITEMSIKKMDTNYRRSLNSVQQQPVSTVLQ